MWVCGWFFCEYLDVSCYVACYMCPYPWDVYSHYWSLCRKQVAFCLGWDSHAGGQVGQVHCKGEGLFKKVCFSFNLHFIIKIFLARAYIHWITHTVLGDRFELYVMQQGCYACCWCHHFPHIHLHGYIFKLHVAVIIVSGEFIFVVVQIATVRSISWWCGVWYFSC